MFDALARLTDRARRRDTGSYFGSMWTLLNHIIIADLYWLNRFKPINPDSAVLKDPLLSPPGLSWDLDLRKDFDGLRTLRPLVDERIIAWFEECPENRYGERFEYTDSAGKLRSAVAGQAFEFLLLHQIHHRGQVSQMLDAVGLPNNIADNGAFLEGAD